MTFVSPCFLWSAAHGVVRDIMREYRHVFQGPPGPPGHPGYSHWLHSHGNATDLVEYIKCEWLSYRAKIKHVWKDCWLTLLLGLFAARGLLRDTERVIQGPPGPPGYSRLFGSDTNVSDLVEYIKSKEHIAAAWYSRMWMCFNHRVCSPQVMEPSWDHLGDQARRGRGDFQDWKEREVQ